jgi:RNA polymerase sigma-70 factor (ECF subfamily)
MSHSASNPLAGPDTAAGRSAGETIAFDDAQLVCRARAGEMQAFGLLIAKYQDRVYNLLWRMLGSRSDAEELAQETFLRALERLGQFRGASGFYTWVFRIAANLAITHRRRTGRVHFRSLSAGEEGEDVQAEHLTASLAQQRTPAPDAGLLSRERALRLARALAELDEDARLAVLLRDVEDMDYAQIARVLEIPLGTVRSRLHRARATLREKLRDLMN